MADYLVTTLNDELDSSSPTATVEQFGGANDLSLREALALANANPDLNTITFAASLSGGTLFLTQGELTITFNLTINGDRDNDGIPDITISADSAAGADGATTRVFHIGQYGADGIVATLGGLVIRDGIASSGGGIYIDGAHDLWLAHSPCSTTPPPAVAESLAIAGPRSRWRTRLSPATLRPAAAGSRAATRPGSGSMLRPSQTTTRAMVRAVGFRSTQTPPSR